MKHNLSSLKFGTVAIILGLCLIVMIAGCLQPSKPASTVQVTPTVSPPVATTVQPSITGTITPKSVQAVATSTSYNTYSNSAYRFSLEYPGDWDVNELAPASTGALETQIPPGFGPRYDVVEFNAPNYPGIDRTVVQVEVDPAPFTNVLDDYYVKDVAWITTNNMQLEITKRVAIYTLSGQKAYRLDYRLPSPTNILNKQVNIQRAYVIIGGKAYIITYRTYGADVGDQSQFVKYYNIAQGMFDSFKKG